MSDPREIWICGQCLRVHDSHDRAVDCCPPEIWQEWTCGGCAKRWMDVAEAARCCAPAETAAAASNDYLDRAMLEHLGQQRLID